MTAALAAPSPLRDGEVALLPVDAGVAALLVAASHDEVITRWTQVPPGLTMLDAGLVVAGWADNSRAVRLQVSLPELSPAGLVTVWVNHRDRAEVGYWLLEPARGWGVGRRAVQLLCDWTFATSDVDELELTTLPGNVASEKVAVACGFHAGGTIDTDARGNPCTLNLWVRPRAAIAASAAQRDASGR